MAFSRKSSVADADVLAQKKNIRWLGDYIMAFALIIGMASAVIFTNILG